MKYLWFVFQIKVWPNIWREIKFCNHFVVKSFGRVWLLFILRIVNGVFGQSLSENNIGSQGLSVLTDTIIKTDKLHKPQSQKADSVQGVSMDGKQLF